MELSDIQKRLNEFSQKLDLITQAKESCSQVIQKLLDEHKGDLRSIAGFDPTELIYEFDKQTFVFNAYFTDEPFVKTEIGIYINDPDKVWVRGLEPVGKYELDTNLGGVHIDDCLYFDKSKEGVQEKGGNASLH